MVNFKIPEKFNLMGRTITVEYSQEDFHSHDMTGTTKYRDDKITIAKFNQLGKERTQQQLEIIFLHELIHWIFYSANGGVGELHTDEKLVEVTAGLLREALLQIEFYREDNNAKA